MTKYFDIEINPNDYESDIKVILKEIKSEWDVTEVQFRTFTEGITNKLIGAYWLSLSEIILFRINGNKTDLLLDRQSEVINMEFLNKFGFAPRIYATFRNGITYEYIPGVILNTQSVFESKIWRLMAQKMAQLHKVPIEMNGKEPMLRRVGKKYLDLIPDGYSKPDVDERITQHFPDKFTLQKQFDHLMDLISFRTYKIVFCHNDLLLSNIIYAADTQKISFIDFEYAEENYQYFDIGNHFAKMAGASSDNSIDYSRFPSKDFQKKWLKCYLEEFFGREPTSDEVRFARKDVKKFVAAAHFLWTCWCLVQAEYSSLDFDYVRLAKIYYDEYRSRVKLIRDVRP